MSQDTLQIFKPYLLILTVVILYKVVSQSIIVNVLKNSNESFSTDWMIAEVTMSALFWVFFGFSFFEGLISGKVFWVGVILFIFGIFGFVNFIFGIVLIAMTQAKPWKDLTANSIYLYAGISNLIVGFTYLFCIRRIYKISVKQRSLTSELPELPELPESQVS